jgi:outer membrane receptor for ferrienterochelin and colicins
MKVIITILLLIIIVNTISAQDIQVKIADAKTKEILIGASVYWQQDNVDAITDLDGIVKLPKAKKLPQYLIASYVGYTSDSILVTLFKDNYILELETENELNNVNVVGKKLSNYISSLSTIKVEKLSNDEFKKAACCNLSEAFQTNGSVDVTYQDAASGAKEIKLLGLRGIYIQNLIGAVPSIRGVGAIFGIDNIPSPWVQSISISKGMPSVKSGNEGITGSLNVDFKNIENDKHKLYFDMFVNNFARIEHNLVLHHRINENLGTSIMLNSAFNPKKLDQNQDNFLDQPKTKQFNALNSWHFEKNRVEGQYLFKATSENRISGQKNYNTLQHNDSIFGINISNQQYEAIAKTGFMLSQNQANSIGTQFLANYHKHKSLFGNRDYNATQGSFYANILYQSNIKNEKHNLVTGINFTYDYFDEKFDTYALLRKNYLGGIYAEYTFKLLDKLSLVNGLRLDYSSVAKWQINPRLHIKYEPIKNTILYLSGGKGYRVPNVLAENSNFLASSRKIDIQTNNKTIDEAWNYGVSLYQKFMIKNRESYFIIDYFRTDFTKQAITDIDQQDNTLHVYNLNGKSYSNSLLTELNVELAKGLKIKTVYRFEKAISTFSTMLLQKALQPTQKGLISISYATPNKNYWQFDFNIPIIGKQRLPNSFAENIERRYTKKYIQLNFNMLKKFKKAELFMGVENMTNFKQSEPILNVNQPYETGFDATQVYAPINGVTFYGGFRIWLDKEDEK